MTTGINAIHMKTDSEWAYNIVGIDVEPKGAFFTLNQLSEIPGSIKNYVSDSFPIYRLGTTRLT